MYVLASPHFRKCGFLGFWENKSHNIKIRVKLTVDRLKVGGLSIGQPPPELNEDPAKFKLISGS